MNSYAQARHIERTLSHSETESLLSCGLQHDLKYVGQTLGGICITPKIPHYLLRRGKAWGIGAATWHTTGDLDAADTAMHESIDEDVSAQKEAGVYQPDVHAELFDLLRACLAHYAHTMPRLELIEPERQLLVEIPGLSDEWRLDAYLDGIVNLSGETFLYEAKFRERLSSLELIARSRQPRWYAAAWRILTGKAPAGVIVDERLAKHPEPEAPVKYNADGAISKRQACTPGAYLAACREAHAEANLDVLDAARKRHDTRTYHGRHILRHTEWELDEALEQMRSAARLITLYEDGTLTPIRNPGPQRCPHCFAREICDEPTIENALIFYNTTPPKRLRPSEAPPNENHQGDPHHA